MRWISILTFSRTEDAAPPFNSLSLNPRSPDVDPTFPFVETVTTTDSLDGFIFDNTFTFTPTPSVETYTAAYTSTFDLVEVTGVDVFHLTAPGSEQTPATSTQPLSTTFTQSTVQSSTTTKKKEKKKTSITPTQCATAIPTRSSSRIMASSPPLCSEKRLQAPVIAGGVVGALLGLGGVFLLFHVLRRRAKRRNGPHLPLDDEMAAGPPADEKGAQIVAVLDEPVTSTASEQSGDVGTIQAERDPNLLAEQIRVLKAQLQAALQAQDNAPNSVARTPSTATDAPVPGPSATHSLSTMKRERTGLRTVRNYEPVDLRVHTDSGIDLDPGQAVEELPPVYVPRKSVVGQTVL
ncbi:hypothetical protein B0H13DRAFT_1885961 [Mycena leptocephala]|nr:hypothetical protein B0H13DRAFT_1885961 [Mycena leptocephala]